MFKNVADSDFDLAPDVPIIPADQSDAARDEPHHEDQVADGDLTRREMGAEYAELLDTFGQAIRDRVAGEQYLQEHFGPGIDARTTELKEQIETLRARREGLETELEAEFLRNRQDLEAALDEQHAGDRQQHESTLRDIERQYAEDSAELESRYSDSAWVMSSVMDDSAESSPKRQFERFESQQERTRDQQTALWTALESAYAALASERRWPDVEAAPPEQPPRSGDAAQSAFEQRVRDAEENLAAIRKLKVPPLFIGFRPLVLFGLLWAAALAGIWFFVTPQLLRFEYEQTDPNWIGIAAGMSFGVSLLLFVIVYVIGYSHQAGVLQDLQQNMSEAMWLRTAWQTLADKALQQRRAVYDAQQKKFAGQRQAALDRYQRAHDERRDEIEQTRAAAIQTERARFAAIRSQFESKRDARSAELEAEYQRHRTTTLEELDTAGQRLLAELEEHSRQRRRQASEAWHHLKSGWDRRLGEVVHRIEQAQQRSRELFPDWPELVAGWQPHERIPPSIRVGEFAVDLNEWEAAVSQDMRLAPRSTQWQLPATLPFPNSPSLLLRINDGAGRAAAVKVLQTAMLRLLTLIPPGKLRFTIFDPVGLGESFAGFMHLADVDEMLVTSRIWTEPARIEERLADLTEHMENVLQKYLRNEFSTIEEYNQYAGEVAEPYHILVIADFPAKFSEIAGRRLTSIVTSGPRCGVYTLMSHDERMDLPNAFTLSTLHEAMTTLTWRKGAFHLDDRKHPLARWPLDIEEPPPPDDFTRIVKRVGDASRDARRVEVSFERVAPAAEIWQADSRKGISIPLGRAGATKLQEMRLGRGTSQHMLIAGKTGSGKSTLLHCLITNVALHYSPEEVRFFLIDFKKGVEFKAYASLELPHADVVAIESDREFGVSALARLDRVLQERGELFRRHSVQDIAGFRNANPGQSLPRILLVIDEFQEFFVEDDKLSQTASLLLDRLVRQGRAFGIHVILGSQTLGGAYSLARSTLGQVAVRVALQCSEADAHLILSEENTAARLLSRPGEAIYNDANGLLEGNHPFQVAWLPDDQREEYLRRILQEADALGIDRRPAIVFEGNIPSDPRRNVELTRLLRGHEQTAVLEPRIWLGEAVEIKDPTELRFRRAGGNNLLIVGPDEDAAQGTLAMATLALLAQTAPGHGSAQTPDSSDHTSPTRKRGISPQVYVFDGSPLDGPQRALWDRLAELFGDRLQIVAPRDTADVIARLWAEQQRRDAATDERHPPLFLVIHHLSRFRDLRKGDDEFSFGSFGSGDAEQAPEPGKQFADLLSGGPEVGMHTLVWCDSYNNADRWFSRQSLREFEYRIAFQMNASDSTNLIDTPAASKLGVHRALLYREETGTSEKFRPYGLPDQNWLAGIQQQRGSNEQNLEAATDLDEFRIL